jgi:hypothetical protein
MHGVVVVIRARVFGEGGQCRRLIAATQASAKITAARAAAPRRVSTTMRDSTPPRAHRSAHARGAGSSRVATGSTAVRGKCGRPTSGDASAAHGRNRVLLADQYRRATMRGDAGSREWLLFPWNEPFNKEKWSG